MATDPVQVTPARKQATRALHEWNRRQQDALQTQTGDELERILRSLPDLSDLSLERYAEQAYPIVHAGQSAAAGVAARYTAYLAGAPVTNVTRGVFDRVSRSDALVSPDSGALRQPIIDGRQRLALNLDDMEAAKDTAVGSARLLASNQLTAIVTVAVAAGLVASGLQDRTQGWRIQLAPDACQACMALEGEVFDTPDEIPFHPHDRCTAAPITE